MAGETLIKVSSDEDVLVARQAGRRLAQEIGFWGTDVTLIATAISEIARNIIQYAKVGEIVLTAIDEVGSLGIEVIGRDNGPGIEDIGAAMRDGYTTGRGMGLGLPGARRLMDDFEIASELNRGTRVVMKKWLPAHG